MVLEEIFLFIEKRVLTSYEYMNDWLNFQKQFFVDGLI